MNTMHTCEIVVRNYGFDECDKCGKPATKSVLKPACTRPGYVLLWLCDEHYAHAAREWTACEF